MTALATSGVIDCSGIVAAVLRRYREVGQRIADDVEGHPGLVRAASARQQQQAQQLTTLVTDARQRSTALASSWRGGAYDAYAAAVGRTCDQLTDTATKLAAQAQKLAAAATALEGASSQMTALLADFDAKASQLVAQSHMAAPGAVQAFVDAANRLGASLADAAQKIAEDLSRALDVLAGNDPTKPEGADYGTKTDVGKTSWGVLQDLNPFAKKDEPASTAAGRLAQKTTGTVWKWDNDGKPLWEWGTGDKATLRTDPTDGAAAGVSGSWHAGPQATADAKAGWEGNQLSGDASARLTVLDAKTNAYATIGPVTGQAGAEAYVGADASLSGKVGLDGGSLKAEAFAGGKIEGSVSGDVGGVGAGVTGSLRYGVGAQLDADASYHDGVLSLDVSGGAALGVGGTVGGKIVVDVPKMWDTFEHYDPADAQTLRDGATWVGNTAHQASDAIGGALDRLEGAR